MNITIDLTHFVNIINEIKELIKAYPIISCIAIAFILTITLPILCKIAVMYFKFLIWIIRKIFKLKEYDESDPSMLEIDPSIPIACAIIIASIILTGCFWHYICKIWHLNML